MIFQRLILPTTRTLASVLAALATAAFAAESIPSHLQKEADLAFAQGKPYFIWSTNAEPVSGQVIFGYGSFVGIAIQVMARSATNTPHLRTYAELDALEGKNKEATTFTSTFPAPSDHKGFSYEGPGSSARAAVWAREISLTGVGVMRIRLIPAVGSTTQTNALSNTLEIKVTFQ